MEMDSSVLSNANNDPIRREEQYLSCCLQSYELDRETLHIRAYFAASSARNPESPAKLGYMVILCDQSKNYEILHFRSYSAMDGRSLSDATADAFADVLDRAYTTKIALERILKRYIQVITLTHSKLLFYLMVQRSNATENRPMVDLARSTSKSREVSDIALIQSEFNPADPLTDDGDIIITDEGDPIITDDGLVIDNPVDHPIEQWLIRE